MNLSRWSLRNRSLVLFFMLVAIAAGISAFFSLGRDEDPPFTIRTMVVQAAWPGATLEDTVLQLTERLERRLQEVEHLDFLRSYTNAGLTVIFVNLRDDSPAREIPRLWQQVRNKIGDIRHTLPQGVVGPFFNDEFGDTFGIIYGFTADGFTQRELRDYVEAARSRLLNVKDVEKIDVLGAQDERIFVEFSLEKLAGLGLDRSALIAALEKQNLVRPSGIVHTADERVSIRVSGAFRSEQDVLDVNFVAGGRIVRLGDIADVTRGFADPPQPMFRVNGTPAIGLAIAMREGGDVLALGENVENEMAAITADLPLGIEAHLVADQPQIVDEAVGEFMESLWQSIAIILVVSFISLGLRAGAIVGISIPLILAIVFPIMGIAGIDMQRISLGALIIALALMVDDAMTTIDAIMRRRAAGDDMEAASGYAFSHFAVPMLIGTLVTIAGFVPIGFAQSSAGEYTFSLFAVVTIALLVSWVVALLFTPILASAVLPKISEKTEEKPGAVMRLYRGFLTGAMRGWWLTIPLTLAVFAASVYGLRFVSSQFFPASDRLELMVDVGLPQNASIYATEATVDRLEKILAEDPDVARWSSYIGQGAIRFYLPLDVKLPNPFFAQLVVIAKDFEARLRLQPRLQEILNEQFPELISGVSPLELGPPAGWPVQYRVSGPDVEEVRRIALRVADVVAANPSSRRVNFDWFEPSRQLRIDVDQDEARLLGLSTATVAQALDGAISGTTVTQVRDDIYLINVVTRATAAERVAVATLRNLQVPGPGGSAIPLTQFATIESGQEYQQIWRRDRVPTLTVQANVAPGVLPDMVVSALAADIEALDAALPPDYQVELGGIAEESADSQASVFAVVPLMLLLMLTLLMVQLRSFARLFILLSVVPLGLIGVVAALLISDRPLGFVAILGILALMGMIAKNAVILIEQIESDRAGGMNVFDAVVAAASSRFRPIMLTALSTVLAMIPIAFTVFWGPMAVAIMGGLFVATLLTLVFLPTLYYTCLRERGDAAVAKPAPEPAQ